jgi:hypothetical protein
MRHFSTQEQPQWRAKRQLAEQVRILHPDAVALGVDGSVVSYVKMLLSPDAVEESAPLTILNPHELTEAGIRRVMDSGCDQKRLQTLEKAGWLGAVDVGNGEERNLADIVYAVLDDFRQMPQMRQEMAKVFSQVAKDHEKEAAQLRDAWEERLNLPYEHDGHLDAIARKEMEIGALSGVSHRMSLRERSMLERNMRERLQELPADYLAFFARSGGVLQCFTSAINHHGHFHEAFMEENKATVAIITDLNQPCALSEEVFHYAEEYLGGFTGEDYSVTPAMFDEAARGFLEDANLVLWNKSRTGDGIYVETYETAQLAACHELRADLMHLDHLQPDEQQRIALGTLLAHYFPDQLSRFGLSEVTHPLSDDLREALEETGCAQQRFRLDGKLQDVLPVVAPKLWESYSRLNAGLAQVNARMAAEEAEASPGRG